MGPCVLRAGVEPAVSWLRATRDIRYSNGALFLRTPPRSRTPAVPVRSRARYPLRQRRSVPPRGLEPLQSGLKIWCPAGRARAARVLSLGIEPSLRLLIRQLRPPCRPERIWLATAGLNRAVPAYQTGLVTG